MTKQSFRLTGRMLAEPQEIVPETHKNHAFRDGEHGTVL